MASKQLSERAKRRLRIAAALLRGQGTRITFPREEFYDRIQALLGALHHERHATLKALVDWVEDYDLAGDAKFPTYPQTLEQSAELARAQAAQS